MHITLDKINDEKVKAVPLIGGSDNRPVKGSNLLAEPYCNLFICAKKASGKTSVIFKIITQCAGPNSKLILFVPTFYKDPIYRTLGLFCEKKNIEIEVYTSLIDDESRQNILSHIVNELQEPEEEPSDSEEKPKYGGVKFESDEEDEDKRKKRKQKYLYPEVIFLFDDIGNELHNPAISTLLKKNRHIKSKVIISSQYFNDLAIDARRQLDYLILFGRLPEKKLKEIYKDCDISVDYETFLKLYKLATSKQYHFLYIDIRQDQYRINFTHKININ